MNSPPVGIHILSNLSACDNRIISEFDTSTLEAALNQIIASHKLRRLGSFSHQFDGGGITCLVALAESHIAIHTWPELSYVTLEVYICNYQRENFPTAERIHTALISLFAPGKVETHRIPR